MTSLTSPIPVCPTEFISTILYKTVNCKHPPVNDVGIMFCRAQYVPILS